MVTDRELASAIRSIGADGEPFSGAELRAHLGITTDDRRRLTGFNDALRSYYKNNSQSLEQVGRNRYRLLDCEPEVDEGPRLRQIVIRITRTPAAEEPKSRISWLWSLFDRRVPGA